MREPHDDVHDGEDAEHEEDVEVDETEPSQEGVRGAASGVSAREQVLRCGAIGGR